MNKPSKLKDQSIILKEFHRLLRSGKDYSTSSMYKEAGAKMRIEGSSAGNIIRKHYQSSEVITDDMKIFVKSNSKLPFVELMKEFGLKFKVCERESRLIIGYIR